MAAKTKLKVQKRKITGRKIKSLRKQGIIPANIYGKDIKSLAVKLPVKDFHKAYKIAGETNIIELQVDKGTKTRPVLVHNIHRHPVTDYYLHIDFHQVDLTKKVTVNIPVELAGVAPAVSKGGILVHQISEVKLEALPADLPDKFELDISNLEETGQSLTLKDLKLDAKKVTIMVDNLEEVVVQIEEPKKEEEKPSKEEVKEKEAEAVEGEEAEEGEAEEAKEGEPAKEDEKIKAKETKKN